MGKWLFSILLLGAAGAHAADESQIRLKEGAGRALVVNNCATCHSLDYIPMNSPFLDRKGWNGEVNKMIDAMHAPIDKASVLQIVDYLVRYYGVPSAPDADVSTPKSH